jgi:hypothetical protein
MNRKIVFLSSMTIAAVSLFCTSGHIGNQQASAFGGLGHGFGHVGPGFGHVGPGFGHLYRPGFDYYYSPGYVIDNPCGGGPYSIIDGQAVCTTG